MLTSIEAVENQQLGQVLLSEVVSPISSMFCRHRKRAQYLEDRFEMAILELSQIPQALPPIANCLLSPQGLWLPWPRCSTQCSSPPKRPTWLSGRSLGPSKDAIECLFTFVEKALCGHW